MYEECWMEHVDFMTANQSLLGILHPVVNWFYIQGLTPYILPTSPDTRLFLVVFFPFFVPVVVVASRCCNRVVHCFHICNFICILQQVKQWARTSCIT